MWHVLPLRADNLSVRPKAGLAWTLLALLAMDVGLETLFRVPADPRVQPSKMQAYFDYGRSVEGKLRRFLGPDDDHSALIVLAGWIDTACTRNVVTPAGRRGLSIHGNSFSNQLADQLERLDTSLSVVRYGGPGAPPNHSYGCFRKESVGRLDRQPVQVFGVTTTSLPRMESIWGATTSFEYPQPFTYPRYRLDPNGALIAYEPSVRSPDDLRLILSDRLKWNAWVRELEAEDYFYAPGLFSADLADRSTIGRMVRRAFGQDVMHRRNAGLRGPSGQIVAAGVVKVLPAMISDFAKRVRDAGQQPIVVLFEERGHGGELARILGQTLAADRIDYVSSAAIAPASDPTNFVADGHFTPEVNAKIGQKILNLMHKTFQ
jgi:hypothetical protein